MRHAVQEGERLYLRPVELEDLDRGWLNWINDPQISYYILASGPTERAELEKFYRESQPPTAYMFAICDKSNDKYVGNARLSEVDQKNRKCLYGRLIGDVDYRGKGYGTEVLTMLLRYAFVELGMNRVHSIALAGNEMSLRNNEKVGMKREGILRQALFWRGEFHDVVKLAMLRTEFENRYGLPHAAKTAASGDEPGREPEGLPSSVEASESEAARLRFLM